MDLLEEIALLTEQKKEVKTATVLTPQLIGKDESEILNTLSIEEILSADEIDSYIERAGIIEYEGNLEREKAEKLALRCVLNEREYSGFQKLLIDKLKAIEIMGACAL